MKRLAILLVLLATPSLAQQPSAEDGKVAVYKQLLARSQDELATIGAQLQAAQSQNAQQKAEIDKLKADGEKKP